MSLLREVDMDGKVDLWEVMAYILGRKSLNRRCVTSHVEVVAWTGLGVLGWELSGWYAEWDNIGFIGIHPRNSRTQWKGQRAPTRRVIVHYRRGFFDEIVKTC